MSFPVVRLRLSRIVQVAACVVLGAACSSDDPDDDSRSAAGANAQAGSAGTNDAAGTSPAGDGDGDGDGASGTDAPVAGSSAGNGAGSGSAGTNAMAGASGDGTPTAGTGSTNVASADWAMMGYDLGSTYFNAAETTITKDNAADLTEAWTADFGGNVYGAPLQIGDKIYANGPSTVRAFDAESGDELWSATATSTGSLAFDDGKLYLNSSANIVAIDAENGNILWTKPQNPDLRADGTSSPLVAGDLIAVGGSNGGLELSTGQFRGFMSGLDLATGDVRWNEYTVPMGSRGAAIWSSPSADLEAGIVYGTTGNNYGPPATDTSDAFIAFNMETGTIAWKNQRVMNDTFGGGTFSGPDADFGANPVLYQTMVDGTMTKLLGAGSKGGDAHAVRADNGELVWTRSLCPGNAVGSQGIFTNSTWTGKYLMVACNKSTSGTLYGLDGATGDIAWMRDISGLVWGRTAAANGVGFVGVGQTLEIVDLDTGAQIKSIPSKGGTVAGTITVAHGRVAFGEGLSWSTGVRGTMLTVLKLP